MRPARSRRSASPSKLSTDTDASDRPRSLHGPRVPALAPGHFQMFLRHTDNPGVYSRQREGPVRAARPRRQAESEARGVEAVGRHVGDLVGRTVLHKPSLRLPSSLAWRSSCPGPRRRTAPRASSRHWPRAVQRASAGPAGGAHREPSDSARSGAAFRTRPERCRGSSVPDPRHPVGGPGPVCRQGSTWGPRATSRRPRDARRRCG